MKLLKIYQQIHGLEATLRLLKIANVLCNTLASIYDEGKGRRLEALSKKDKDKLWMLSNGADDRIKFCKSVMVLLYEDNG